MGHSDEKYKTCAGCYQCSAGRNSQKSTPQSLCAVNVVHKLIFENFYLCTTCAKGRRYAHVKSRKYLFAPHFTTDNNYRADF